MSINDGLHLNCEGWWKGGFKIDHLVYAWWKKVCIVTIPLSLLAIWVGVTALSQMRSSADHEVPSLVIDTRMAGILFLKRLFGSVFHPRENIASHTEVMKA